MIDKELSVRSAAACALASLCLVRPAVGQVLEEVTVTAQKREQRLQDVGVSVAAFTNEQLDQLGVTNTFELGAHTPGLVVSDTGGGTTTVFTMRGSGQLDFADHEEAPVAVYVDGAYNSFLGGVGSSFFDLERVEVLRGPQGTLFGRNATGGVVQLVTKQPTANFEAYTELTGGQYGLARVEAALGGPLTEKALGRLAIFYESTDGYQKNLIGTNQNKVQDFSGRAQLLLTGSDDLEFRLAGYWTVDRNTAQGYDILPAITDSFVFGPIAGGVNDGLVKSPSSLAQYQSFCQNFFVATPGPGSANCFGYVKSSNDPHTISANAPAYFNRDFYGGTGTLTWKFGGARLVSVTDYKSFKKHYQEDSDGSPLVLMTFPQNVDATQFSQELRLEGQTNHLDWVGGAYYLDIDGKYRTGVDLTNALALTTDNAYTLKTKSWAAFTQEQYKFTDHWSLTAGLRWTDDRKRMVLDTNCIEAVPGMCQLAFGGFIQVTGLAPVSRSEGNWSGTLRLDYQQSKDLLLYGGVTRGHKAGGFNAGAVAQFTADQAEYHGEILTDYEAGFKATLFNQSTSLNGSFYYYKYNNFQTFFQQSGALIVFNVDAQVLGSEIELVTRPWKGWEFTFGTSLLDANEKNVPYGGITKDRPMPNAPKVSVNALARYEWSAFGGSMNAQVDYTSVGSRSLNAIDSPALQVSRYSLTNVRLGYTTPGGNWEGSVFVNNVADTVYFHTIYDISTLVGSVQRVPGPPRWAGASIKYKWR